MGWRFGNIAHETLCALADNPKLLRSFRPPSKNSFRLSKFDALEGLREPLHYISQRNRFRALRVLELIRSPDCHNLEKTAPSLADFEAMEPFFQLQCSGPDHIDTVLGLLALERQGPRGLGKRGQREILSPRIRRECHRERYGKKNSVPHQKPLNRHSRLKYRNSR